MKKLLFLVLPLLLCGFTCQDATLQASARDTAAALQGAIVAAQAQYQMQCSANPKSTYPACSIVNQAVAAQNALITADEAYCGWSAGTPPSNTASPCIPVATAEAGLQTAVNNASSFVMQLKGVIQ